MTYLAILLITLGLVDLTRWGGDLSTPTGLRWRAAAAVLIAPLLWWGFGLPWGVGLLGVIGIAAATLGWLILSARALSTRPTRRPERAKPAGLRRTRFAALAVLAAGILVAAACNGLGPRLGGGIGHWYGALAVPRLHGLSLDRAAVAIGGLLVQVGTANVVVRLVLDAAGATRAAGVLRGGRLLGPMERLLIYGLGLAGQATAASVVIAAKGLLRFPELQDQRGKGERIDAVTEYFLVGSFVSWMCALAAIVPAL